VVRVSGAGGMSAIRLLTPPAPPAPDIPERDFQQLIVDLATAFGWEHHHQLISRGSDPGWPDLVLCRPPKLLLREIKREGGKLSQAQLDWGWLLRQCGADWDCWYPRDWQRIVATLTREDYRMATTERPTIVCLCGSTRFWRQFQRSSLSETMAGRIVLSIGAATGTDDEHFGNLPQGEYDRIKAMLDNLHLRKIDLCDEVLILNCGDYVGQSTMRELGYARAAGKRVRWLEPSRYLIDGEDVRP